MRRRASIDKLFALLLSILVIGGCMIFSSAAIGLIARGQNGMQGVVFNHVVLGIGLGLVLLIAASQVDYHIWKKYAPYLFGVSILLTGLVFVPHIGAMHGGGRRWITLFHLTIQPSETLKFAGVLIAATFFSHPKLKVNSIKFGLGGYASILALPALILVLQPDLGTLAIVVAGITAIYFMAGARMRDLALVIIVGFVSLAILATIRPYVKDRIMTFINPGAGQQTEGYQIRQSLIAVGSGGFLGRGFGQGVQKFTYLPEPMGDSIYAVAAEELGFVGAAGLIVLFLLLALRGFSIAAGAPDLFGALLAGGLSTTLITEAFVNIAAMLGVLPLTGIPLTFVSQGGSAILISLASAGVLLNISKFSKKSAKME